jgi:AraC family transcriptional regulator, positive regulator of tynA and feaB
MSVIEDAVAPDHSTGTTWSSDGLAEDDQFPSWAEISCVAFCPVTVTRTSDGPFRSAVAGRAVGPLGVSRIRSQAQSVARTGTQVARDAGNTFFLNMPLTQGSSAGQDGRTAVLGPGDFTIVDSARPFALDFTRDFTQISLALPHEMIASRLIEPETATALRVDGSQGVGAVAGAAVRAAAEAGPLDRGAAHALADHLAGLVALAIGGVAPPGLSGNRTLLAQAAFDEIERSLADPQLSPTHVAHRLSISSRYLHSLFAERGTTFGRWLLHRRLQRCRAQLTDPAHRHRTVADVAFANGFTDPSYFTRAFRTHYGMTPRQLRTLP